jgi:hypothetical protein
MQSSRSVPEITSLRTARARFRRLCRQGLDEGDGKLEPFPQCPVVHRWRIDDDIALHRPAQYFHRSRLASATTWPAMKNYSILTEVQPALAERDGRSALPRRFSARQARPSREPRNGPQLALIERFVHPLDRQLAGVKLTLSPNRNTVTADPQRTDRFPRSGLLQYGLITTCLALSALCCEAHQRKAQAVELCP